MYDAMNATLAHLHEINIDAVGLADFGRHGGYFERQIARWLKQYNAGKFRDVPAIERLGAWLGDHLPADGDETTLVHGDYRLGNLMFHPDKPEIVAVLDWELSTLGHPLSDLGYNLMVWFQRPEEYHGLAGRDLAALGIPALEKYVANYFERRGLSGQFEPYYTAFAFFRLSVIFEGISARARQMSAASEDAGDQDAFSRIFAEHGLRIAGV